MNHILVSNRRVNFKHFSYPAGNVDESVFQGGYAHIEI